jgi:hypothetical protein
MVRPVFAGSAGAGYYQGDPLTTGAASLDEATLDRRMITSSTFGMANGNMRVSGFSAGRSRSVTSIQMMSGTVAGAGATLLRVGLYDCSQAATISLIGSTADVSTTAFIATNTVYTLPLLAATALTAGGRYAVGFVVVGATTAPNVVGLAGLQFASLSQGVGPSTLMGANLAGQTDLPASFAWSSLASLNAVFAAFLS